MTLCKSIGYIDLIFCCDASISFNCFQSLFIVAHKIFTGISFYSSMQNSSNCLIFCGFRLWTLIFKVLHKFSIGLKLGVWLGRLKTFISLSCDYLFPKLLAFLFILVSTNFKRALTCCRFSNDTFLGDLEIRPIRSIPFLQGRFEY